MRERRQRRAEAGVTLIEMLVVVTIIALFAGLVMPTMFNKLGQAKPKFAQSQIKGCSSALGMYRMDVGSYPTNEQGLQALRTKPQGVESWQGPYLPQDIPTDPWGRAYVYKYPGEHGDEPEVISLGADGQPGGEGENADIISSEI